MFFFTPIYLQAFDGSLGDGDSVVATQFPAIKTRYVKFNPREPLSPRNAPHNLCMRIEVFGCTKEGQ